MSNERPLMHVAAIPALLTAPTQLPNHTAAPPAADNVKFSLPRPTMAHTPGPADIGLEASILQIICRAPTFADGLTRTGGGPAEQRRRKNTVVSAFELVLRAGVRHSKGKGDKSLTEGLATRRSGRVCLAAAELVAALAAADKSCRRERAGQGGRTFCRCLQAWPCQLQQACLGGPSEQQPWAQQGDRVVECTQISV